MRTTVSFCEVKSKCLEIESCRQYCHVSAIKSYLMPVMTYVINPLIVGLRGNSGVVLGALLQLEKSCYVRCSYLLLNEVYAIEKRKYCQQYIVFKRLRRFIFC